MKLSLDVSDLERVVGREKRFQLRADPVADPPGSGPDEAIFGPVSVDGRAIWTGSGVLVSGRASSRVGLACGLCLREFCLPLEAEFTQEYTSAGEGRERSSPREDGPGAEHAVREKAACPAPDTLPLEGDHIDLALPVTESLVLSLPMKPVCGPECRGLCPVCGSDLNQVECGCRGETVDPRLVSLKKLLDAKERGE